MSFYQKLKPILFSIPPETAHEIGIHALRFGLSSEFLQRKFAEKYSLAPFGEIEMFGLKFKNPVGIAAGFDKNGVIASQLSALGFGFVEIGTTTFHAQSGNEKPRLFRLPKDEALINRAGFNNQGTAQVVERLRLKRPHCVLGMNIGKSKIVPIEEATEDYLQSFNLVHDIADYVAVNVSSPNTPNLRELQKADALENLLSTLQKRNLELSPKPLLVKIAPDLSPSELEAIVDIALRLKLAGIIATNTTISRENLVSEASEIEKIGNGGLSGKPLQAVSTKFIAEIFRHSKGKLPIIGVGGIFDANDAFEKICAGASLVQLYTGFVYQGWTIARDINAELAELFAKQGFKKFEEAIGAKTK